VASTTAASPNSGPPLEVLVNLYGVEAGLIQQWAFASCFRVESQLAGFGPGSAESSGDFWRPMSRTPPYERSAGGEGPPDYAARLVDKMEERGWWGGSWCGRINSVAGAPTPKWECEPASDLLHQPG
jgi:hypothetical protein